MSINSFSAIVGDSDGATFVTKAEFEELKENLNEQINRYNTSIDSKIDGRISSYVSGIHLDTKYDISAPVSNYRDIKWKNDLYVKIGTRTWTNYNTYTTTSVGWQIPKFGDFRLLRAGRYYFDAARFDDIEMRAVTLNFNGGGVEFKATDGWFPTGEGKSGAVPRSCDGVLVFRCDETTSGIPELRVAETYLLQRETQIMDYVPGAVLSGGLYTDAAGGQMLLVLAIIFLNRL